MARSIRIECCDALFHFIDEKDRRFLLKNLGVACGITDRRFLPALALRLRARSRYKHSGFAHNRTRTRPVVGGRKHDIVNGGISAGPRGGFLGSLNRRSSAKRFNLRGWLWPGGRKVFCVWRTAELRASGNAAVRQRLKSLRGRRSGVPPRRVNEIIHGKRAITLDTSLRLGRYFGQSERFWLNVQTECDLRNARQLMGRVAREVHPLRIVPA